MQKIQSKNNTMVVATPIVTADHREKRREEDRLTEDGI
jgi:hypothetical protein